MNQDYSILEQCPLFHQIKPEEYSSLLNCIGSFVKHYQMDEFLFLQGDQINHVGVLLSGALELTKANPAGVRHILDFLSPSHLFAEGIVWTPNRTSPVTVRAKDVSTVLFIPQERLLRTCTHSCGFHHQLIQNMMVILGEKNMLLNQKIDLLTIKGMREKLATYLLIESKKNNSLTFTIIPNRNELAEFLNVSRPSMCRELARMKDLEMIDYYQNSFRILSLELLTKSIPVN